MYYRCIYTISAIAQCDWPDEWPDLFNQLVQAVASGNPCLVHGAIRVLFNRFLIVYKCKLLKVCVCSVCGVCSVCVLHDPINKTTSL